MIEEKVSEEKFHLQATLDLQYLIGIVEGMCKAHNQDESTYTGKLVKLAQWHYEKYEAYRPKTDGKIGFKVNGGASA